MKRIQRGPVRNISLKLQEEERERRLDFVPEKSAVNTDSIRVDPDTMEMLTALGMEGLPNISVDNWVRPRVWSGTAAHILLTPPFPLAVPAPQHPPHLSAHFSVVDISPWPWPARCGAGRGLSLANKRKPPASTPPVTPCRASPLSGARP